MKNLIVVLSVLLMASSVMAQNYKFKFKVKGAVEGQSAYLANYFGEQLYYYDTAKIEKNGVFRFERDEVTEGAFAVVVPGGKYFEVILTEKEVDLETDTANFVKFMKVNKSEENKAFYEYFAFINEQGAIAGPLRGKKDSVSLAKLRQIDKVVRDKQIQMVKKHKDLFFAQVIGIGIDTQIPEEVQADTNRLNRYLYYKNHFWDLYNLEDERIVRTPVFAKRFNYFFDKVVAKHPDSLNNEIDKLIDQLPYKTDLWKYVVHTLTYKYETSKIMGLDAVFVHLGLKYYARAKDGTTRIWWLDEKYKEGIKKAAKKNEDAKAKYEQLKASPEFKDPKNITGDTAILNQANRDYIAASKALETAMKNDGVKKVYDRAKTLEPLRLEQKTPHLILKDTVNNKWVDIHKIPADWTLLVFWDPGCGHCKKEIPKLNNLYQEIKNKVDIKFVGINTELYNEAWVAKCKEFKLDGWIHISDDWKMNGNPRKYVIEDKLTTLQSLNFRDKYDIFSTPQVFLLDKDKKIVAKKMGVVQLVPFLENLMKIDIDYVPPADKKNAQDKHSH